MGPIIKLDKRVRLTERKSLLAVFVVIAFRAKKQKLPSAFALGNVLSVAAAATAAVVTAVAVPVEDKKDKNNYPNITVVKNVAEASHGIIVLSVSFKRSG